MGTRKDIYIEYNRLHLKRGDFMVRKNYVNVSIPETLINQIDQIVDKKKEGYTSRAEFIKDCIREKIRNMKK